MSKYELVAINSQGANVEFYGKNKAEALRNFDFVYSRSGWKIEIKDSETGKIFTLKKTFQ